MSENKREKEKGRWQKIREKKEKDRWQKIRDKQRKADGRK